MLILIKYLGELWAGPKAKLLINQFLRLKKKLSTKKRDLKRKFLVRFRQYFPIIESVYYAAAEIMFTRVSISCHYGN